MSVPAIYEAACSPHVRARRLDAWADRQPDVGDPWAELAAAAKAAIYATAALMNARGRAYADVPWDGAGGAYRVLLPECAVWERDVFYLGQEYADGLAAFARQVLR